MRRWLHWTPHAQCFGKRPKLTAAASSTWLVTQCWRCSRRRPEPLQRHSRSKTSSETSIADVTEDRHMLFRIGVHLGDVIEKADGTVYGDGVNIAARLQGLAEPGGIVVSDSVRTAVKGKIDASFLDQGEQAVKNIPDPLRAFKVISGSQAPSASRSVDKAALEAVAMPTLRCRKSLRWRFCLSPTCPAIPSRNTSLTESLTTSFRRFPVFGHSLSSPGLRALPTKAAPSPSSRSVVSSAFATCSKEAFEGSATGFVSSVS